MKQAAISGLSVFIKCKALFMDEVFVLLNIEAGILECSFNLSLIPACG